VTVVVRHVGPAAAGDVLSVVRAAFGARPPLDPPADAAADTEETIAADLAAYGGLLATLDGRPAGALIFKQLPDALYLRRFGVVPDAQGHGVAAALVDAAVEAAIGHECMGVVAREELPATIAFWERHGFVESHRRPPYVELRRPLTTSYDAPDADAMRELGTRVGSALRAGDLVVLTGELGAGKTTFTQGLGEGLGVRGGVTSPTFVIARVHPSLGDGPDLVHVDAYRLGGVEELDDLDLDTSLDTAVTVVEWGAGLAESLAEQRLDVTITRALADEVGTDDLDPRRVEVRRVV
jgi:tRNA threonylcarbamoyladenosine biosynthesis protein TsaE